MQMRVLDRSFSAGELTPELYGRVDFDKFGEGLALCRNFQTLPHGPAINRPGTEFVKAVKNSAAATRLIPFSYNSVQTFAIEIGAGYIRWHSQAGTLAYSTPAAYNGATAYAIGDMCSSGGTNYYCIAATTGNAPPNATYWYALPADLTYEIPNSYAAADLMTIRFVQSSDTLTLTHPSYPVQELKRYGATNWQLSQPTFNPPSNCPTAITATATTGAGAIVYDYVVTSLAPTTLEESIAGTHSTCTNDLTVSPNKNTITWTAPTGTAPIRYNVYRLFQGIYGYIGQAASTSFVDQNITPDTSRTPPLYDTTFASATNYPSAVSYFQQRRIFGGTASQPQNVWMTKSGTESNMSYSIPTAADNRLAFRIAAREASAILHIVPAAQLILLTASCEWSITSSSGGVLAPSTVMVAPQSYNGAGPATPVVVGNIVLYASARGGHIRELSYSWQAGSFISADISLLAPHLFDYNSIIDMAFCRGPVPTLWAVSSTGKLLGMTYVPEQKVAAWHQHDTGASDIFESICVIAENNEDMLYAVVKRTINGSVVRYVERLHTRNFATLADAFFVDCGMTYSGAPATTVSGLSWLEGMTVSILADGAVSPQQVVTGGTITLPVAASKITVGLPISAQIRTLPVAAQVDNGLGQGRPKNVNRAWLRVYRSSGINVGEDLTDLTTYAQRTTEVYGSPPSLVSDEVAISLTPAWGRSGQIYVQQTDPLPLDIASIALEVEMGG